MSAVSTSEVRAGDARAKNAGARDARTGEAGVRPAAGWRSAPAPRLVREEGDANGLRDMLDARGGVGARARYFGTLEGARVEEGTLVVPVASAFLAGLAERRFGAALREAAREMYGAQGARIDVDPARWTAAGSEADGQGAAAPVAERCEVGEAGLGAGLGAGLAATRSAVVPVPPRAYAEGPSRLRSAGAEGGGRTRHTFETFLEGASNALAMHAAQSLANGDARLSPLFIHGPCGTGKTHLVQAVAHAFRERAGSARVRCLTAEAFTNEFITAMRGQRLDEFRKEFRRVDLLCLDDVHFIADKKATQAELLHTFDAVDLKGKLVVLASDEHPDRIARLNSALASRFVSGAVTALAAPDAELCRRLLAALAARREVRLEPGAESLLLQRFESLRAGGRLSVRDVEAAVTQVVAMSRLTGERGTISASLAARALGLSGQTQSARARRPVPVERIVQSTCEALGVERSEFSGRSRGARVVLARGLTAVLAREMTNLSFPEIARAMGRPNHSSVITAMNRMKAQLEGTLPVTGLEGGLGALRTIAERLRTELAKAAGGPNGA